MFKAKHASHCKRMKTHKKEQTFHTAAGNYVAEGKAIIEFSLPDMNNSKVIKWPCYLDSTDEIGYDAVIGRDLMLELGIKIDFDKKIIQWDDLILPMQERSKGSREANVIVQQSAEPDSTKELTERTT